MSIGILSNDPGVRRVYAHDDLSDEDWDDLDDLQAQGDRHYPEPSDEEMEEYEIRNRERLQRQQEY